MKGLELHFLPNHDLIMKEYVEQMRMSRLSDTKLASQNRSDHGGREQARKHSVAEIAGSFTSLAAKKCYRYQRFRIRVGGQRGLAKGQRSLP